MREKVAADKESLAKLIEHLRGLSTHDVRSLAHQAIFNDGAIQQDDMELVMQAKYRLLGPEPELTIISSARTLAISLDCLS